MLNFTSKYVACISDIHLGVHQNSHVWHDIAINFANWLDTTLKQKNIKDIIIAGDIFHNRHEIGVDTIHTAYKFFDILKDYNIVGITGNHDCYYKDKSDINSVAILNKQNVRIFEDVAVFTEQNRRITFCPWGTHLNKIPLSDIIVGHFEILNFKMNQHKVCDHGLETENLLDKAQLVVSGHFHYREHRKYKHNKSILYLGSPYELDFGDRDQVKGISILDLETLDIEFIENKITPKHRKIKLSELLNNKDRLENISNEIENNFISLCIDCNAKPQIIDLVVSKFAQFKPKHIRTDYNIFEPIQLSAAEIEGFSIDIDTALQEFVNMLDTSVNKKDILDKCLELYKLSLVQNE
jgi:DNA repair exonuclease SbcCD nuclease subunit